MIKKNYIIPVILGLFGFILTIGSNVLIPTNIGWLSTGDAAQHYLGWSFFRNSPWTWPIGLNPGYGLELSSGIISSDSNPLFAFIFKSASFLLPEPFQYFGFWILLCFILQAFFAWKLLSLISEDLMIQILGTLFFVFAPPFLNRITAHMSLGAHFLILAALYLSLKPQIFKRKLAWSVLISVTALVHPYLLAMVALLWISNLFFQIVSRHLTIKNALLEFAIVFSLLIIACWQEGYFIVGVAGAAVGGFGIFRMNLLSPIDSFGWSYLIKSMPHHFEDWEGFNYLGLGLIILCGLAVFTVAQKKMNLLSIIKSRLFLLVSLICLAIFALSDHIGIGERTYTYHFPLLDVPGYLFRSSGRMFWPFWYMILFTVIFILLRAYKKQTVVLLLSSALMIQVFDTSAGWKTISRAKTLKPSATWDTTLKDPFWDVAATRYQKLRNGALGEYGELILGKSDYWTSFAYYCSTHQLGTDIVNLSRIPRHFVGQSKSGIKAAVRKIFSREKQTEQRNMPNAYHSLQNKLNAEIENNDFDKDSLYILNKDSFDRLEKKIDTNRDLLAQIDGMYVFAPNWYKI